MSPRTNWPAVRPLGNVRQHDASRQEAHTRASGTPRSMCGGARRPARSSTCCPAATRTSSRWVTRGPLVRMQTLHPRYFEFFDLDRALSGRHGERGLMPARSRPSSSGRRTAQRARTTLVSAAAGGHTEWYRGAYALAVRGRRVQGRHRWVIRARAGTGVAARADGPGRRGPVRVDHPHAASDRVRARLRYACGFTGSAIAQPLGFLCGAEPGRRARVPPACGPGTKRNGAAQT